MAYFGGVKSERLGVRVDLFGFLIMGTFILCTGVVVYMFSQGALKSAVLSGAISDSGVNVPAAGPVLINQTGLVAARPIRLGEPLTLGMFEMKPVPVTSDEMGRSLVSDVSIIEGQFAKVDMVRGSPLMFENMTEFVPTNALTAKIPDGSRAVTITVDGESGVEGWVRPGALVDVVWTTQQLGRGLISTIVERAEVLSVERSLQKGASSEEKKGVSGRSHVTLLVKTKDAQRIQLAKTSGALSLNLRGDGDVLNVGNDTLTVDRLVKRSELQNSDEAQGLVEMNGKKYALKGRSLVLVDSEPAR